MVAFFLPAYQLPAIGHYSKSEYEPHMSETDVLLEVVKNLPAL